MVRLLSIAVVKPTNKIENSVKVPKGVKPTNKKKKKERERGNIYLFITLVPKI